MPETKPTNPKDLIGITKLGILTALSTASILWEAWAMRDGVRKYGAFNYREKGVRAGVYIDACMRHIFAWFDREESATDSGVHHLAHAKACLGIIIDGIEQGNLVDDRPPIPGTSPAILERLRLAQEEVDTATAARDALIEKLDIGDGTLLVDCAECGKPVSADTLDDLTAAFERHTLDECKTEGN